MESAGTHELPRTGQVQHACLILLAAEGTANMAIDRKVSLSRTMVVQWRQRFIREGLGWGIVLGLVSYQYILMRIGRGSWRLPVCGDIIRWLSRGRKGSVGMVRLPLLFDNWGQVDAFYEQCCLDILSKGLVDIKAKVPWAISSVMLLGSSASKCG